MDEHHFWLDLEYDALESGGEIWASGRPDIEGWWCDGFELDTYALDAEPPYIEGWIYTGKGTDKRWRFRLDLRNFPRVSTPEEIDWEAIYPVRGKTGWLTIDTEREFVGMDFSIRDEPVEDIIVRRDYPSSFLPRNVPTPEADIVSGDAERTYRNIVHTSPPAPRDLPLAWPEKQDGPTKISKAYFWDRLEWRVGYELRRSGRTDIANLEMDGISIDAYELDGSPPRVEGTCWLKPRRWSALGFETNAGYPRARLGPYRFLLKLDAEPRAPAPRELNFEALLPEQGRTDWLTVDTNEMLVVVDPSVSNEPTEQVLVYWEGPSQVIPQAPIDFASDGTWRHARPELRARVLSESLMEEDGWRASLGPDEQRFWEWLEILVSNEISASGRADITGYRFERITVDRYLFDQSPARIEGTVWFLVGDRVRREQRGHSDRYRFVLIVPGQSGVASPAELDFEALVPEEGYTGWLTIDPGNKLIEIDPSVRERPIEDILFEWGRFTIVPAGAPAPEPGEPSTRRRRRPLSPVRTYRRHVRGAPSSD